MSFTRVLEWIWKFLISLRLAVTLLVSLAISLMAATIIESVYDTKTAQYFVYRAGWFYFLLTFLGLNILAVALSRYPWKWKHTPFLMAHAGILMLLTGAWLTYIKGLDGNLRISENEVSSSIEMDEQVFSVASDTGQHDSMVSIPIPWVPPAIASRFKPIELKDYGLKIDRYLSDADSKVNFVAAPAQNPTQTQTSSLANTAEKTGAAVQIRILGAPMGGAPELWLWTGESAWSTQKMGPARFLIRKEGQKDLATASESEARIDFIVSDTGSLRYETTSVRGEKTTGTLKVNLGQLEAPQLIDPHWRMPIKVQVKKFLANALNKTDFVEVTNPPAEMGGVPNPAIHLSLLKNSEQSGLWLGLGDRAEVSSSDGRKVSVGFFPKLIVLPFALRLKKFEVVHDPGSSNPAAYASHVQVVEDLQKTDAAMESLPLHDIQMNEPLNVNQYTFYQASYIPDFPRPTTTILSVNYDPGRALKYWGSILLVLGSILLFAMKSFRKKERVVE